MYPLRLHPEIFIVGMVMVRTDLVAYEKKGAAVLGLPPFP